MAFQMDSENIALHKENFYKYLDTLRGNTSLITRDDLKIVSDYFQEKICGGNEMKISQGLKRRIERDKSQLIYLRGEPGFVGGRTNSKSASFNVNFTSFQVFHCEWLFKHARWMVNDNNSIILVTVYIYVSKCTLV